MTTAKKKILIQLDRDPQPSVFDGVVALDSEVDQLFRHGGVTREQVRELVYGAIFTRGAKQLHNTAIFIGGRDVAAGEVLLEQVVTSFFGPLRVSVMLDANGANTTAAAAAVAVARHIPLNGATVLVMAATGPVGQRAVRLLAGQGATVRAASRRYERAEALCATIAAHVRGGSLLPLKTADAEQTVAALNGVDAVIAAGAPGAQLISAQQLRDHPTLKVAIDLNAVPPLGIELVEVADRAAQRERIVCYGAIGVGHTKMKIHTAAVQKLFTANNLVLDAAEIHAIGRELENDV